MFCKNCGIDIPDGTVLCPNCGKPTTEEAVVGSGSVTFVEAIKLMFVNYANFTGRATKSEYWWAFLFNVLVSTAASYIPVIGPVISLALIIPGLSLGIRRLHDIGKSWCSILLGLIPLVGFIILIVLFCRDSDGDNQWGPAKR